ncbi:PREDICTED: universal stress protein PHOS32 [Tarenaya hassleriana]|uniref:universal stress protein PHOS32 n=1 Tax=Tarenaya hassleriana TaxID=28532 RepID=UPI00053C550C|nr:PREDICTED: universal stress protein PHOS32 [Tarenaya hassleriana]
MGKPAGYWVNKIRTSFKGRSSNKSDEGSGSGSGSGKRDFKPTNPGNSKEEKQRTEESKNGAESGRKVMIVADATSQSKNALQWALVHCVQDEDSIILLHVIKKPRAQAPGEETQKERASRAYEQLQPLKNLCQLKKPNVKTEIAVVEVEEEKGRTIVEESKKQGAGALVIGQRKRQSKWRVIWRWRRESGNGSLVEYCIHNADCMAIAVRKKSNNGGYLITTKRHKDFWLLA